MSLKCESMKLSPNIGIFLRHSPNILNKFNKMNQMQILFRLFSQELNKNKVKVIQLQINSHQSSDTFT